MSYSCHKLPFAPSCIEHCVRAQFINEYDTNLIVARSTLLQIYALRNVWLLLRSSFSLLTCKDIVPEKAKLDLVFEQNLSGRIEGLGTVRLPGKKYVALERQIAALFYSITLVHPVLFIFLNDVFVCVVALLLLLLCCLLTLLNSVHLAFLIPSVDCLVLCASEAKISVLEWDAAAWDLRLVSLHFYENDDRLKVARDMRRSCSIYCISYLFFFFISPSLISF
jgi:hypothetical protein